jgi:hypothetical protein
MPDEQVIDTCMSGIVTRLSFPHGSSGNPGIKINKLAKMKNGEIAHEHSTK